MAAVTRWVRYDVTASGYAGSGNGNDYKGTRGYSLATAPTDPGDSFDINSSNNRLYLSIDGDSAPYITLTSGTDLDPRFVARDITEKLHNLGKSHYRYDQAQCVWENNKFKLYSGTLGSASSVTVVTGTNTVHTTLGWSSSTETGGITNNCRGEVNEYSGTILVSGTYNGFFDEMYEVVMAKETTIGTVSKGGSNTYTGTMTVGGMYIATDEARTYTITITASGGNTMGAGSGNVPSMSWTSTGASPDNGGPVELLYPDYWYMLGTKGLMVKFSDGVFNSVTPAWTIPCTQMQYVYGSNTSGPVGSSYYIWRSTRGDNCASAVAASTSDLTLLGSRGLYIKFSMVDDVEVGDTFYVVCTGPQPVAYDITGLTFGNVTVSTDSPLRCVMFEIMSGAVELSTVKFGLQSHGTFVHHDQGNADTEFHFGTVGPGNNAGVAPLTGKEWRASVVAANISSNTPPEFLYATKEDLAVVSDADSSESVGSSPYFGMCSDPIWLSILLGSSETGANSTINYRLYYDFS